MHFDEFIDILKEICKEDIRRDLYWCLEYAKYLGINNVHLLFTVDEGFISIIITLLPYEDEIVKISLNLTRNIADYIKMEDLPLSHLKISMTSGNNVVELIIEDLKIVPHILKVIQRSIANSTYKIVFHECKVEGYE